MLEILHGRSVLLLVLLLVLLNCCGVKGQHAYAVEIMAPAERLGMGRAADKELKIYK